MRKKDFGLIFWLHLVLILAIYSSPFWISWKIILLFVGLYYLQLLVFKNCVLTNIQFNESQRDTTFYSYYLGKLGLDLDKRKLRIFLDYFVPWIILLVALALQLDR